MKLLVILSVFLTGSVASALGVNTKIVKPKTGFEKIENDLLVPLDLKIKTVTFHKKEVDHCGLNLMRDAHTLNYSCMFSIPTNAKVTKFRKLLSPNNVVVEYGNTKRPVQFTVSEDAKTVTVSTSFDSTGIDFDVSKFNDDFFPVYDKTAQLIIGEAIRRQALRLEVLESR